MLSYGEILEALHRELISDSDLTKMQKTYRIDNSDSMPQNAGKKPVNRKYTMGVTLTRWTAGSR